MGKTDRKKVPKTAWGLGKESAVEPVSIVLNSLFRYTSSWYTLWLVYFWQFTSTLTSFTWLRARWINIGNRSAARGFSEPNSLSFPPFFSSASLVTIKQSLPTSVGKNTIAISFAILNSQELSSVLFFRQKALWFENPKSLQCLENAQRDTTNIAVNKETLCYCLGNIYLAINLVVKYSGTIRTCTKFSKRTYCTRKCGQTTTCIQCLWKTIVALLHLRMLCHQNFISVISVVQHNQLSTSALNK